MKSSRQDKQGFENAIADARRWTEHLGSQVLTLSGKDAASEQALAEASERYNAASGAVGIARTIRQAQLARESALEGMYYIRAARTMMGMSPGPDLPELEGQRRAGTVLVERTITLNDGSTLTSSPTMTTRTPQHFPGGVVAGKPVPAGWYSFQFWAPAMQTGEWPRTSALFYNTMFPELAATLPTDGTETGDPRGSRWRFYINDGNNIR